MKGLADAAPPLIAVTAAADAWVLFDWSHAAAIAAYPATKTASAVKTSLSCFMSHLQGRGTAPLPPWGHGPAPQWGMYRPIPD